MNTHGVTVLDYSPTRVEADQDFAALRCSEGLGGLRREEG